MQFTRNGLRLSILLGLASLTAVALQGPAAQSAPKPASTKIQDYVASKLDDFSATMRVVTHNDKAGEKINKDFGLIYKVKGDILLRYKEENKLRIDGTLGASKATLINNGSHQMVRFAGIKSDSDLGPSPGKRKTLLDVGLISEGYLAYTEAEFKRMAPVDGVQCAVFKISYKAKDQDSSFRMVWIDPRTKITLKREEYSQLGKLNATFYYKTPVQIAPGVWFPSQIEAYNNEGQKAGVTAYSNVKVNVGIGEDIFK